MCLEQATGIEPALKAWEALILPLNYACVESFYSTQKSKIKKNLAIVKKFCFTKRVLFGNIMAW